jgi:membrane associated rhomboid family serine protease
MWPVGIAGNGDLYRLATAPFLHANILHIAMNMLGLYFLGPSLERLFGHARFAVLYLVAALGGSVASYLFSAPMVASVGASGAVFGLMGAWVVAGRRYGYDITPALILIAVNVVLGFTASGLDWRAHLGGLVTGAVVAGIFAYAPATSRTLWQILGVLAVLGVIVLLTMWRTAALRSLLVTDLPLGALGAVGGLLEGSSSAVHAAIVLPLLLG